MFDWAPVQQLHISGPERGPTVAGNFRRGPSTMCWSHGRTMGWHAFGGCHYRPVPDWRASGPFTQFLLTVGLAVPAPRASVGEPGAASKRGSTAPAGAGQPAQARVLHSARSSLRCAPPGDRRPRSQYGPNKDASPFSAPHHRKPRHHERRCSMAHRHTPSLRRLAWERLWRILLAPPTEVEQARLQCLRDRKRQDDQHTEIEEYGN